ncbi:YbaN family protein [Microvirga solisilvae]|uniref:YbaN family protein n=1 Tax=Microvirga solisilvae TaxID=2919498 RepID=UPI001FAE8197|nr:YbaN family protein [Microvirga solisilvae]
MRRLYLSLGYASLALGILGIVLPVLPTTPFVILAAWCFTRSNPALAAWLYDHPRFGTLLTTWRDQRAISPRTKVYALLVMAASYAVAVWLSSSPYLPLILAVVMGSVGLYIATRPTPRP